MTDTIALPPSIIGLVTARNALREQYSKYRLNFTLDGNLVGDIGEALVAETYGLKIAVRNSEGIDAISMCGKSVQIKASGTGRGPAFRNTRMHADHLVVLQIDFDKQVAKVIYNGPEKLVRALLPNTWTGQRAISLRDLQDISKNLRDEDKLFPLPPSSI